ncbi:tyrosyl-DNA phosphodiesterase 1-like isoform X1 [Nomia melanderi]|uniref:tyrosyl-DNA phosphodiesterase 1-like isoform X1 n=2 Tax=Nomia melanderi TaxID=2448451 RepID=UPI003FCEB639
MDNKAETLFKFACNDDKSSSDTNKVNVMEEKLNTIKLTEEILQEDKSCQIKGGDNNSFTDDGSEKKKSAVDEGVAEGNQGSNKTADDAHSSTSSERKSLMESYQKCKSTISREKFRAHIIAIMKKNGKEVVEPGNFAAKYALAAPYHIFFPRIEDSKETYDQQFSITFPEILDKSLGEIVCSLQINFMLDVDWLCLQYVLAGQCADMLVLYGTRLDEEKVSSNMKIILVEKLSEFTCHHTKIMILKYIDGGIRIVVSTANLYLDDWENRTQGLWISPHLPPLADSAVWSAGESPTHFKKDLLDYLHAYRLKDLKDWISIVRKADFSAVNVFFLASVPGQHMHRASNLWGHRKLATILSKYITLPPDAPQWPIVAQSSSVGVFGPNYKSWVFKDFVRSASAEVNKGTKGYPDFKYIFPTRKSFLQSFDFPTGSTCLNYPRERHAQQEWLESYLYEWKASREAKDKAMPHIKSYTRFSPDWKRIPWFVLTSANLSKAAWGNFRSSYFVGNYEAGVVFVPQFVTGSTTFPVQEEEDGVPVFPIPYDIPLTKYEPGDKPAYYELDDIDDIVLHVNTVPD